MSSDVLSKLMFELSELSLSDVVVGSSGWVSVVSCHLTVFLKRCLDSLKLSIASGTPFACGIRLPVLVSCWSWLRITSPSDGIKGDVFLGEVWGERLLVVASDDEVLSMVSISVSVKASSPEKPIKVSPW